MAGGKPVEGTLPREEEEVVEVERKLRNVKSPSSSSLSLVAREHARKLSTSASSVGHVVQRSVDGHADQLRISEAGRAEVDTLHIEEGSEESRPMAKAPRPMNSVICGRRSWLAQDFVETRGSMATLSGSARSVGVDICADSVLA